MKIAALLTTEKAMISSDIIKTKLIKMEELRKQTVDRIAAFFNGDSNNPKVDTYKKLLDFEKEIIKAINYSPCCKSDSEQLVCDNCDGDGGRNFTEGFLPCPKCKGSGLAN